MRLKDLTNKKFDIDAFKAKAMKMWIPKFKREYGSDAIVADNNTIFFKKYGETRELVTFNNDNLYLSGQYEDVNIPYGLDEYKFIKTIEKKSKEISIPALKNLKALKDDIELEQYNDFDHYLDFFKKLNNSYDRTHTRQESLDKLGIKHIRIDEIKEGDEIYAFDLREINLVASPTLKIEKTNVYSIWKKDYRNNYGSRINDEYDIEKTFYKKSDAELAYIYYFWIGASNINKLEQRLNEESYKPEHLELEKLIETLKYKHSDIINTYAEKLI